MMRADKEWLDGLAPGSIVAVESGYGTPVYRLERVSKVTQTQIVLPDDCRYRKDSGARVGGGGYRADYIMPATDEIRAKIRTRYLAAKLSGINWYAVPLPMLETIYAAVSA
jgi:hypothetical protein